MASRATAWRRESSRAWSFGGVLKTGHLPGFRGPSKNRGPDPHPHDGIAEKTSTQRKNLGRRMSPCIFFRFCPYGPSSLISALRGSLVFSHLELEIGRA